MKAVYLDSCAFIELVKADFDSLGSTDREKDVWHIRNLLQANRDKEIRAYTSVLTIAECTHGGEGNISSEVKKLFTSLLSSGDYVTLIQVTPFIAMDARDLRWEKGINLRGPDGIHAASAINLKCDELLTMDGRFNRLSGHEVALGLSIKSPRNTSLLPERYRQQDWVK